MLQINKKKSIFKFFNIIIKISVYTKIYYKTYNNLD